MSLDQTQLSIFRELQPIHIIMIANKIREGCQKNLVKSITKPPPNTHTTFTRSFAPFPVIRIVGLYLVKYSFFRVLSFYNMRKDKIRIHTSLILIYLCRDLWDILKIDLSEKLLRATEYWIMVSLDTESRFLAQGPYLIISDLSYTQIYRYRYTRDTHLKKINLNVSQLQDLSTSLPWVPLDKYPIIYELSKYPIISK